jgi:hypothetical protein
VEEVAEPLEDNAHNSIPNCISGMTLKADVSAQQNDRVAILQPTLHPSMRFVLAIPPSCGVDIPTNHNLNSL